MQNLAWNLIFSFWYIIHTKRLWIYKFSTKSFISNTDNPGFGFIALSKEKEKIIFFFLKWHCSG